MAWYREHRALGWEPLGWERDFTAEDLEEIGRMPPGTQLPDRGGWAEAWLDGHEGWLVRVRLDRRDGVIYSSSYEVRNVGGEPLRLSAVGKRLGLGSVCERIAQEIEATGGLHHEWADSFVDLPRTGRRARNDSAYLPWAEAYVEALAENPRRPLDVLTERYPNETRAGIQAKVNRARSRDLLTKGPKGKAGGELTDKAREMIAARPNTKG